MNNEEKAIEMIKFIKDTNTLIGFNNADRQRLAEIILNLIEKQQKEIEYWKEQAEGYSGLAKQIQEDFENRDRWE